MGQGTEPLPSGRAAELHCQAFDMLRRDATQLAGTPPSQRVPRTLGLVVGNLDTPREECATAQTTHRLDHIALEHLARHKPAACVGRGSESPVACVRDGEYILSFATQNARRTVATPISSRTLVGGHRVHSAPRCATLSNHRL